GAGAGAGGNNPLNLVFAGQQLRQEGAAGMSLIEKAIDEAKQFELEATRFASLGFGAKVNAEAQQFALGMKTFGTSARTNMTLVSDAMAVFKDLGHAEIAAPIMAQMKFANEALFPAGAGAMDSKFMDMLKVIEFRRGLSSSAEFETQANYVQKVIAGSRNRVDATQLLTALKTGGVALSGRSNKAFYLGSEPLIQEFGGSRYGTGAMSIYQNLVQSRGTITAQQELFRLGLLDRKKVEFNDLGKLKKALPGAFLGSQVLEKEGELALLEKVLLPAFAKKGITGEEGVIRELGMILGNRTGSSLMSRIYQQRATLHMQADANRSAMDIKQADSAARGILQGKENDAEAKWRDVLRELGMTVLPIAIRGVQALTGILKGVSSFAQTFPTLTKGLVIGFAAVSGALLIGGAALLAAAGLIGLRLAIGMLSPPVLMASRLIGVVLSGGLRIAGQAVLFLGRALLLNPIGLTITAIATAAYLLWRNWDVVGPKLAAIWDAIKSAVGGLADWMASKWAWFKSLLPAGAFPSDPHQGRPGEHVTLPTSVLPTSLLPVPAPGQGGTGRGGAAAGGSPFVATGRHQTVQVTSMLHMDGRKVAEAVSFHQVAAAGAPLSGITDFDGSMFLAPVGLR
ncbi:MAG: hypothetical protein KGL17_06240, partial [Betaproteobacteria bacterium]|nr:hypothetical protein [Betaproteobacteria bacterium]